MRRVARQPSESYALFNCQLANDTEEFRALILSYDHVTIQQNLDSKPFCPIEDLIIYKPDLIQVLLDLKFKVIPTEVKDQRHMSYILGKYTSSSDYDKRMWRRLIEIGVKPTTRCAEKAAKRGNLPLLREMVEEHGTSCSLNYMSADVFREEGSDLYSLLHSYIRKRPITALEITPQLLMRVLNHTQPSDNFVLEILDSILFASQMGTIFHERFENEIACFISIEGRMNLINNLSVDNDLRKIVMRIMDEV